MLGRLLPPSNLPRTLWDSISKTLLLPQPLALAYSAAIDSRNLRDLGTNRRNGDAPVGGLSREATEQHFAQAFDGSVARTLLAILDPKSEAGPAPDVFINISAGSHLCLTDAPCGAGAASLALLCALAELRDKGVIPRTRLDVDIVGGELSEHARAIAEDMLRAVDPFLREQAIFIAYSIKSWDVTCEVSTAALIRECVRIGDDQTRRLVVVANFTDFLEKDRKRKDAEKQIEELFRYSSGDNSLGLWIEPNMNTATNAGGLFAWLASKASTSWRKFARLLQSPPADRNEQASHYATEAKYERPLAAPGTAVARLAVASFQFKNQGEGDACAEGCSSSG